MVETALTAKAGWNGLGVHRMIAVGEVDGDKSADERANGEQRRGRGCHRLRAGRPADAEESRSGRYMQMIPDGTQLAVLEEKGGWLRVEYRGYTGWVSGEYCCKAGED